LKASRDLEGQLSALLARAEARLGESASRTGEMNAAFVESGTGEHRKLLFSVGERSYLNNDETEVIIVDITGEHGKLFNGRGPGRNGVGRPTAWNEALVDMRRNLSLGHGWLSFQPPPLYAAIPLVVSNPMQLQTAPLDQLAEMGEDAAH